MSKCLGLLLCAEAPFVTPNHIDFFLSFFVLILTVEKKNVSQHSQVGDLHVSTATQVELLPCHLQDRQSAQ